MLDSFFDAGSSHSARIVDHAAAPKPQSPTPISRNTSKPPPPVRNSTRPNVQPVSIPPSGASGHKASEADSFSQYFSRSTSWASDPTWFVWDKLPPGQQPNPPPLKDSQTALRSLSWSSHGAQRLLDGVVVFEDLSIGWYHLSWHVSAPNNCTREAAWAPPPPPWIGDDLRTASEMYGDLVASFAERAMHQRRHVGRGECWDLANESLREIANTQQGVLPKVMPCIAHTHGHLIFTGVAGQMGTWKGGDDTVRRGDIVQWLNVKIKLVGQPLATMTLGNPDHTAIVVSDSYIPSLTAGSNASEEGQALHPSAIGSLDVIEQSVHELPSRRVYDMRQFLSGEVWIYRPMPMELYLGMAEVAAVWPPPASAVRV
ncbi:hypothetical protein BS47DRAFT_1290933 [Hydnum rufescens UP504]|uniref:BBC1/AIM3 cysteine proteinase-fold domain-containing protein n=1 Tax=Hydnum rufescens UP504 TaxID=1448309 RepID=A0A9P6B4I0_9AGAM|nr:hypothetical protein BS47DRAFT_1290933 [Hydnum rufescens UP504]